MRYSSVIILSVLLSAMGCAPQPAVTVATASTATDTNNYFGDNTSDWIYQRYLDVSGYLLRSSDITEEERTLHRRKAYECYFEYWLLHRSPRATLHPVPPFEQRFSRLIRSQVIPHISADDPLGIRPLYANGRCTNTLWIPKIPILKSEELDHWSNYQRWVVGYRRFIGESEPPKKDAQK